MTDRDQPARRRRRRRWTRPLLALAVLAVVAWAIVAATVLLEGRERAEAGRSALVALAGLDPMSADLDRLQAQVHAAGEDLDAARRNLTSPVLTPLRPLPVVGRQLASARALATTADEVVASLTPVFDRVVASRAAGSGAVDRLELLAQLDQDLSSAQAVLDDVDLGPDEALVGPLATARRQAAAELEALGADVADALIVVRGLRAFLDGSTYVVLGANPAEMANGGGMLLSVGELETVAGDLRLADFEHAGELFPVPSAGETDPDVAARWGHLVPGNDFRKLGLTPRFASYVGPRALDLWEASSGRRPTGAVVVDPVVVQALLDVVGPVEVDGASYDAGSILEYAVVEQYREFGERGDQDERRELVADISRAAVQAMGVRSWDPLDLIRALRPTAQGRHLLAYSEDPAQQAMWSLVGVDGRVDGDELLVNVANVGGQKLDPFLALEVTAEVVEGPAERRLRLDVAVANRVPAAISDFAGGLPSTLGGDEPGTYVGRLAVFAPAGTRAITLQPERPFEAYGPDGALLLAASRLRIPPGVTEHLSVELVLDPAVEEVTVLPSGRVPAVSWRWAGETWQDARPRTVALNPGG